MLHFSIWKTTLIGLVSLAGVLFALPNILTDEQSQNLPSFMPSNKLHLGLDLKGGSHMLLKVEAGVVISERMEAVKDEIRTALRDKKIGYTGLAVADEAVSLKLRKPEQMEDALLAIIGLSQAVNSSLLQSAGARDIVVTQNSNTAILVTMSPEERAARVKSAVAQSIEIVRRRIDELGTTEPTIQPQGTDRILVQVPGLDDPEKLKALLGKTAKLTFHEVDTVRSATGAIPTDSFVLPDADGSGQLYVLKRRPILTGENLVDAQPGFSQQTNEAVVSFKFDTSGAKKFGNYTATHVGEPFAIVLDNQVISAPNIRQAIRGGSGQISGGFTVEGANELAILLRAGALPAPLQILEERTVGPGLGADSIEAGKIASIIGLIGVVAFILLSYGLFGLFANIALMINLLLIIGVLSLLQATLTLPGIAGIVLTIGMAVDANVLIFERIREEALLGKSPIASIETGYNRALTTILDANITTFIAAVILFYLGTGPVKGFAITLSIGIITSVFTAFVVTRLMVSIWIRRRRPKSIPI
ncbi:MAG: protein translocase subunit SecD [Rhizobiales bacterium]|nr:protein translocase subunit SecD [Hyphomicrobiales bacterium]NRB12829.1 protein translocase subunit SecD [Hyphomicrobiales bacterium]